MPTSAASTRSQPGIPRPRISIDPRARRGDELVRRLGIDADEDASLAARGDRHVPAHEECEPAEHLLLGHVLPVADQGSDPVGEDLVVRHLTIVDIRCVDRIHGWTASGTSPLSSARAASSAALSSEIAA